MARNPIQFQDGMSLGELMQRFGTEEQCEAAVRAWRWPSGFVCPRCGCAEHTVTGERRLHECHACRLQTSLKAGTIFEHTLIPLTKWFQAMWLITQSRTISTLSMSRQLDLKWDSAWLMKQKLMEVMRQRNTIYKLAGDVQIDDAYLGGEKPGKTGRGAGNKVPFVLAVATRDGKPVYTHVRRVKAFTKEAIRDYATANIRPGSIVVSDGLACFKGLAEAGMRHLPIVTGGGRPKQVLMHWSNTGLGNLKGAINGTCRSCDAHHTDRYLAAYEWRFNRRFVLAKNLERLARAAVKTAPVPHRTIANVRPAAETSG